MVSGKKIKNKDTAQSEKVKIKMESTTKLYLLVIKLTKLSASELTLWSI